MAKMALSEQAQEILKIAEKSGVQSNFFFLTTFKRYQVQLNILNELERTLKEEGVLVSKEYVKGRKNLYGNPAVKDYCQMSGAADRTVSTLMRIIKEYSVGDDAEEDPLLKIITGHE